MVILTCEFSEEQLESMDRLMKSANITTRKDLINSALTFFEWAVHETIEGKVVASIDDSKKVYREVLMPTLESLKK